MEKFKDILSRIILALFVIFFICVFIFPFYWLVITAFKSPEEITSIPPLLFPTKAYLGNFHSVFTKSPFTLYTRNSLIIASLTTIICVVAGSIASYAIARLNFRGKNLALILMLSTIMIPGMAIAPSLFLILRKTQLLNTFLSLVLPYVAFQLPFSVWVLVNFFKDIPKELEDAAEIDGCTPFLAFLKVILPLAAPGIATIAILVFIGAWNEFFFAFVFTTNETVRTLPVGIVMFRGEHEIPWGDISAASTIATLPLAVIVVVLQKRIVSGLTAGALKG